LQAWPGLRFLKPEPWACASPTAGLAWPGLSGPGLAGLRASGQALGITTRLDIAYAVRELARFMANYGPSHVTAAKHLLRYLRGTTSYGITLGGSDTLHPLFKALTDSDWGMGDTRKSVSSFLIMMGDSPISWSSKQQAVVALS
jgi:hypothetical protein